jgi:hypothetical protein
MLRVLARAVLAEVELPKANVQSLSKIDAPEPAGSFLKL